MQTASAKVKTAGHRIDKSGGQMASYKGTSQLAGNLKGRD